MVLEREDPEEECRHIECPVLVTERLVLRPPHEDDLADLVVLADNPRVAAMLMRMPHPYTAEHAKAFLSGEFDLDGGCHYALALAENGAFIGAAALKPHPRGLELGYWIGEPYWGSGYATEAAHALVDLAFRATDIDELHASCRVVNAASRRVIQKCGFHYVGQGLVLSLLAGRVPVENYALDRKTWISLRTWSSHRAGTNHPEART